MIQAARLRDRLPSALIALALQAGLFALLALSFEVVRQLPAQKETTLTLAPLTRSLPAPMTIDARGRSKPAPVNAPPPLREGTGAAAIAPSPAIAAPAAPATPAAPAPGKTQADETEALLHPDHPVKDEDKFKAEMERRNHPPDAGVSTSVGIGVIIQDPLCKLALILLGGGFYCGAPASHHDFTDAQFDAARKAVNDRKRAQSGLPPTDAPAGAAP